MPSQITTSIAITVKSCSLVLILVHIQQTGRLFYIPKSVNKEALGQGTHVEESLEQRRMLG